MAGSPSPSNSAPADVEAMCRRAARSGRASPWRSSDAAAGHRAGGAVVRRRRRDRPERGGATWCARSLPRMPTPAPWSQPRARRRALPRRSHKVEIVADRDWVRATQAQFHPLRITPRLWIVPSWRTPPDPRALNVILDPGIAFGTGNHATTRLCLRWLERAIGGGESVIDYGCGSGDTRDRRDEARRGERRRHRHRRSGAACGARQCDAKSGARRIPQRRPIAPAGRRTSWSPTSSPIRSSCSRRCSRPHGAARQPRARRDTRAAGGRGARRLWNVVRHGDRQRRGGLGAARRSEEVSARPWR